MQLSIIIPVKNGRATLLPCLEKLRGLTLSHEIIVVNDHSTDGGVSGALGLADTIIDLEGATGPGAARNAGAGIARGEILLFLDSDVFTSAADIEKSHGEFRDGHYSCAVARYRHNPGLSLLGRYYNLYMMYKYDHRATTTIFFSSYAMIKKECFLPFPERLLTLEDAALGQRLLETGQEIHIFRSLAVLHHKEVDAVGLTRQFCRRSRDAVVLAWSLYRQGSAWRDDSVQSGMRLSLVLVPLLVILSPFTGLALFLLLPLLLVNLPYFRYIKRFEGGAGLAASVLVYFYTIVCGDIGMAWGVVKVLIHECMAAAEIRKTPLL